MRLHLSELVRILYPFDILHSFKRKKNLPAALDQLKLQNLFDLFFFLSSVQVLLNATLPPFGKLIPSRVFCKYCQRRISTPVTGYCLTSFLLFSANHLQPLEFNLYLPPLYFHIHAVI